MKDWFEIISPVARAVDNTITHQDLDGLAFSNLTVDGAVAGVVKVFLTLIALGAFASIIYSGFMYITSAGDAAKAAQARKNILWALLGVIFAILSYTTLVFVANFVDKGVDTTGGSSNTTTATYNLIVTDRNGSSVSTITLDSATLAASYPLQLSLSAKPAGSVTVSLIKQGNLPTSLSVDSLTFGPDNWQTPQGVVVSYNGNGSSGEAAQIVAKTTTGERYVLRIESPQTP